MSFGLCTGVNLEGLNNDNNNEKRIVLCVDQECSPLHLYACTPLKKKKKKKKNPLSPFPANAYSLHSSLLRDEVDMVSAVSLPHSVEAIPTVWPGFGLLRSASSPHEDPLRVPRTNPPREFCVFAQMRAYKGSGSSVGKKEQLWGVVVRNEKKKKNASRRQRAKIRPPRHCWGFCLSPRLLSFSLRPPYFGSAPSAVCDV